MNQKRKSLAEEYPELLCEWNYHKNGELIPENVSSGSNRKVWWICSKGHEWEAVIANRTRHGSGCPYCSGKKPILGENDLATLRPDLALEWHSVLNKETTPEQFKANSPRKVWWQCAYGHVWESRIDVRSRGAGCPYCSGKKTILKETDLATLRPDIALEWHPTLNEGKTPNQVAVKSNLEVWWKCEKGHEWEAPVYRRSYGSKCPVCSQRKVLPGYNDLATMYPEVAMKWNCEKNGSLIPTEVLGRSNKKVWWLCERGHEWEASINITTSGKWCPYCAGKAIPGATDLATLRPDIALEWHPTLNGKKTSDQFMVSSNKKVWWLCEQGHEWEAMIASRTQGEGCPYCEGKR